MLHYIDALIPGVFGLALVLAPQVFTKARDDAAEKSKNKLRGIGAMLLVAALLIGLSQHFSS